MATMINMTDGAEAKMHRFEDGLINLREALRRPAESVANGIIGVKVG